MNNKTIRKCWLATLIIEPALMLMIVIYLTLQIKLNPALGFVFENKALYDSIGECAASLTMQFLFCIIGSLILYFCAYRKPGTRILTYSLFCQCLAIPYRIYSLGGMQASILILNKIHAPEVIASFLSKLQFALLLPILVSIAWTFFSFKLRRINKKIQLDRILAIPKYHAVFQHLHAATSIEELHSKYGEASGEILKSRVI